VAEGARSLLLLEEMASASMSAWNSQIFSSKMYFRSPRKVVKAVHH